nr:MAG TPA: adenine-specific methyltransferase [Caudoviricetes sp.]
MRNSGVTKEQREADGYYEEFVEKFKPKKTTDDCYTPDVIYDAVRDWAVKEYGLSGARIIRPFWPGGDYQSEDYSGNCVVIDNPPFSILSSICTFYNDHGVRFFLFAPALTLFSTASGSLNYVVCNATLTYENGARVNTSFVTNLGKYKIHCAPDLNGIIKEADTQNRSEYTKKLPIYDYPDNVCTGARLNFLSSHGVELRISAADVQFCRALDAQKASKKAIFGGGFLLSEKAAAEKAAAEAVAEAVAKAAERRFTLSAREWEIVKKLGKGDNAQ